MKTTDRLGEEKIIKLLMEFSVPATVSMLVYALYNIIDRIYIGNSPDLGPLGLTAITISFPLTLVMIAIAMLFGIGGSTLFSINMGRRRHEQVQKYLGNAVTMLIGSSMIYMIISFLFLEPILEFLGASPQVMPYAMEYMRIILLGSIFQGLSFGMNPFIRADGSPKIAMVSMLVGAGFNLIFDPVFIYVFRWGMAGAALATIGGQLLSTIWVISYFMGKRSSIKLKLKNMKPEMYLIKNIMDTGIPSFVRQIANGLLNIVLNRALIVYGGDIAVSAMGIIYSIQTFMIMAVFGIAQGAQPIIGYNFGAKKTDRVKEGLKWATYMATAIVVLFWLVTKFFPGALIGMFTSDPELIAFAENTMEIWFLCLPVVGFQIVSASYFQAVEKGRTATFLTATRQLIILVPAVIILPKLFGLNGILYAAPVADVLSSLVTGIWLWVEVKHLNLEQKRVLV